MAIALIAGERMKKQDNYEEMEARMQRDYEERIAQSVHRVIQTPEFLEILAERVRAAFTPEELEELKTRYLAGEFEKGPAPVIGR